MLVNLVFTLPLMWSPSHELDHLELFAGDCSITKGEVQESGKGQKDMCLSSGF